MLFSDLTYLEAVSEEVTIAGGWATLCLPRPTMPCISFPTPNVSISGNIVATGNVEYFGLSIAVDPCLKGYSAKAEGGAQATGSATYTFFSPNALVAPGMSMSNGIAVASAL